MLYCSEATEGEKIREPGGGRFSTSHMELFVNLRQHGADILLNVNEPFRRSHEKLNMQTIGNKPP